MAIYANHDSPNISKWIDGAIIYQYQYQDYGTQYIVFEWGPRYGYWGEDPYTICDNTYEFYERHFTVFHKMFFDYKKVFAIIDLPNEPSDITKDLQFLMDFFKNIPELGLVEFQKFVNYKFNDNLVNVPRFHFDNPEL